MNLLSSVLSPQTVATAAFLLVVTLTVVGALIAVAARNIFHNVLGQCLQFLIIYKSRIFVLGGFELSFTDLFLALDGRLRFLRAENVFSNRFFFF